MMTFFTYMHRRADDGTPFYIGKGCRDRHKVFTGRSERWHRTATKHGVTTEIVAKWATEADAFAHEMLLIECLRDMGHNLVNLTTGGEGASGYRQSEETKEKRNAQLRGRKKTPETIARMKASQAGKVISTAARDKISATLLGRYAGSSNPNAKSVLCVETWQSFGSMVDAAEWLREQGHKKASFKSVHSAVSGAKKTAYGLSWRRV